MGELALYCSQNNNNNKNLTGAVLSPKNNNNNPKRELFTRSLSIRPAAALAKYYCFIAVL